MRDWICLNGTLSPAAEAQISVDDAGVLYGVGLFELMLARNGRLFRLDHHLTRLTDSARELGWASIPEIDELRESVERAVHAAGDGELRVRLTVTAGPLRQSEQQSPTIIASASPGGGYPPELYNKGVSLSVSRFRQSRHDPLCGHKTTSYLARLASLREAHQRGAFEALWLTPDNLVAEAAMCSVFAVIDDELLTPPLDTPVLPGVARETVMELAVQAGVPVREEVLRLEDLTTADELFLTSVTVRVLPVVRIERQAIGLEKPGDATRELAQAFAALLESECGP